MEGKNKLKIGNLSDERGKILDEVLWELETQIESERKIISNFIINNGERDLDSLRKDLKVNLKNRKTVYNNNPEVESLSRFIRLHEEKIERMRRFEI